MAEVLNKTTKTIEKLVRVETDEIDTVDIRLTKKEAEFLLGLFHKIGGQTDNVVYSIYETLHRVRGLKIADILWDMNGLPANQRGSIYIDEVIYEGVE